MSSIGIYIGRFQPIHNGHKSIIDSILKNEDFVIIIIGSKNKNNQRNPFSYEERKTIIEELYPNKNIYIKGLDDFDNDNIWIENLDSIINEIIIDIGVQNYNLKLYTPNKDEGTKKYLDFVISNSKFVNTITNCDLLSSNNTVISSTEIRILMNDFKNNYEQIKKLIPEKVFNLISR
jgi:bifunctional NMN adenylyltransferase/nudix hydrolase